MRSPGSSLVTVRLRSLCFIYNKTICHSVMEHMTSASTPASVLIRIWCCKCKGFPHLPPYEHRYQRGELEPGHNLFSKHMRHVESQTIVYHLSLTLRRPVWPCDGNKSQVNARWRVMKEEFITGRFLRLCSGDLCYPLRLCYLPLKKIGSTNR